ncbi:MAG: tautomerase family protein [Synergistaceae bacterium]|jgi:4-oxalocrotonate tautomerase|nr:tautomerase family protein [Synergistaceae bacterium]
MPIIQVNLLKGRSADVKRAFAADVTRAACTHLNVKPSQVRIIFHEISPEDWIVSGVPIREDAAAGNGPAS